MAAMQSSETNGKQMGKLEQAYNNLQRDWDAYKESQSKTKTKTSCPACNCTDATSTAKTLELFHSSPRHLMSQLQGGADDARRRLFDDEDDYHDMSHHPIRSLTFCDSDDDEVYDACEEGSSCEGSPYYSSLCSSSSSSSSSLPSFVNGNGESKVEAVKGFVGVVRYEEKKRKINGGRYFVMLGVVLGITLLLVAIFMGFATSYGGFGGFGQIPT